MPCFTIASLRSATATPESQTIRCVRGLRGAINTVRGLMKVTLFGLEDIWYIFLWIAVDQWERFEGACEKTFRPIRTEPKMKVVLDSQTEAGVRT